MKKLMLLFTSLLGMLTIVHGTGFKVGSQDAFNKAVAVAKAGDEIVIINGTYTGWQVVVNTNGTVAKPVVVRAETPGKVLFSGDVNKPVFQITGSYTEISGIIFSKCQIYKSETGTGVLIELKASRYCRITGCSFLKNTTRSQFMPIVVVSGNGESNRVDHCNFTGNIDNQELQVKITADAIPLQTMIDHNIFKDKDKVSWKLFNGGECVQVGQDPILLGTQYSYATVRDNKFINCNGEPEVISNKSSGNSYINNYLENCHGELVMRGGHDCKIGSNNFKGGSGGIRINGSHHTLTNNTFSDLPTGIRFMYGMSKGKTAIGFYVAASDCLVKNNTITNATTGIYIGDSKGVDWTGKFDTTRYPSRVMQDVAPFNITLENNTITGTQVPVKHNEQ